MKWKKFDNTNIENLVNNDEMMKFVTYKEEKQYYERILIIPTLKTLQIITEISNIYLYSICLFLQVQLPMR